jgi:hypothetical protein
MIKYLFRGPVFPIILEINGTIIGANNYEQLDNGLSSLDLPEGGYIPFVDSSGEGWALSVDQMVLSPLTVKKRWTKKEVIQLFNNSNTAKQENKKYSSKSLSSKRFDRIISELVELIRR